MITSRRFARLLLLALRRKVYELDGKVVEVLDIGEHGLVTVRDLADQTTTHDIEPRRLR